MGRRGSASAIIAALVFLAPRLAQSDEGATAQIVLRWTEVAGAAEYELEIAKDAAFKNTVVRERAKTAGFRWKEIPTVKYFWRVRSVDTNGRQSPWSEPLTIEAAVSAPALLSPASGAVVTMGEERRSEERRVGKEC